MKFIGHRGAKGECPENTLMGIKHALECGLDGVEIDLHSSCDGVLTVIHDSTLDRTTNGSGLVCEKSFEEIQKLDAGEGLQVPCLEEVLKEVNEQAQDRELTLFIELKAQKLENNVVETLNSFAHKKNKNLEIIIKSFDHRILNKIHHIDLQIPLVPLFFGTPINPSDLTKSFKGKAISISLQTLDKEFVQVCHDQTLKVCGWNCNDPEKVSFYKKIGIDWLCTDYPSKVNSNVLKTI